MNAELVLQFLDAQANLQHRGGVYLRFCVTRAEKISPNLTGWVVPLGMVFRLGSLLFCGVSPNGHLLRKGIFFLNEIASEQSITDYRLS
jgi:hypothetical protein